MKKLIIILIFLFSVIHANSQWKEIVNIPAPFTYVMWLDVYFLETNPDYGWVCGFGGNVIRTTDGGGSWQGTKIQYMVIDTTYINGNPRYDTTFVPYINQLESIHFASESVGYTSGEDKIFKTTDGGANWKMVSSPLMSVWGVYFLDEDTGFATGGGCEGTQEFHKTTDGGITWTTFYGNQLQSGLSDAIVFESDGLGYASSSGLIWRTDDGGNSWYIFSQSGTPDWQEEITYIDNSFLVPFSEGCSGGGIIGGLRMSTDLGKSWNEFQVPNSMFGTFLLDSMRGWGCGDGGAIYYTSDGGKTWELRNCGIGNRALDDVWFVNDNLGWVVGRGVFKTHYYDTTEARIQNNDVIYICRGDSVVLSSENQFEHNIWSTGDTTESIVVSEPGIYSLESYNNICDFKISDSVEVRFYPDVEVNLVTLGGNEFCEGDSLQLFVTNDYDNILWSTGETKDTISVRSSGTFTVSIVDMNGCDWSGEIVVKMNPKPDAKLLMLGRNGFCQGDSTILYLNQLYENYKWYNIINNDSLLSQNDSLFVFDSGEYYCIVENEFGCKDTSDLVKIEVWGITNRLELTSFEGDDYIDYDSVALGKQVCKKLRLFNNSAANVIIDNIFVVKNIDFSMPQSQLPIELQSYSSKVIDICFRPIDDVFCSDTLIINDTCSNHKIPVYGYGKSNLYRAETNCNADLLINSDKMLNGSYFNANIYPNPSFGKFTIQIYSSDKAKLSIEIYDIYGKKLDVIYNGILAQRQELSYSTSELPQGIYFVRLRSGGQVITKRIEVLR